jgi:nanoRNase/pAp phosphatase (c-di-AMP/oligoRNAs hydrolase)
MDETTLAQARRQLEELAGILPRKGRVLIVPHDYPDPDALASAAAMHLLLHERFHLHGQIVFTGGVSRAENLEMLKHCRYRWHLLQDVRPPKHRVPCIFVDTAPWSGNVTIPSFGRPAAVFDHHPFASKKRWGDLYADVRVGTGATASILYEYLAAAGVTVPKWLASLMAYAITAETLDLYRTSTALDLEAYTSLLARANMTIIGKIRHAPLPRSYYVQLQEALRSALVYGRVSWTHLGSVQQPEIVAEIAELLLLMERITWSFCTGYHGDKMLISLRSEQKGARCGQLLKRLVGAQGSAGGHNQMAAGYLDLAGLGPEERDARHEALVKGLLAKIERRPVQAEPLGMIAKPLVEQEGG